MQAVHITKENHQRGEDRKAKMQTHVVLFNEPGPSFRLPTWRDARASKVVNGIPAREPCSAKVTEEWIPPGSGSVVREHERNRLGKKETSSIFEMRCEGRGKKVASWKPLFWGESKCPCPNCAKTYERKR
jgi:hypothetical protein